MFFEQLHKHLIFYITGILLLYVIVSKKQQNKTENVTLNLIILNIYIHNYYTFGEYQSTSSPTIQIF